MFMLVKGQINPPCSPQGTIGAPEIGLERDVFQSSLRCFPSFDLEPAMGEVLSLFQPSFNWTYPTVQSLAAIGRVAREGCLRASGRG